MREPARCINIDWLEVYAFEPIDAPRDAQFFRDAGFHVTEREYGTRIFAEVFTLYGTDNFPLLEVRRAPKSGAVIPVNGSHIRLVNRSCYYDNAADVMQQFLQRYGYLLQNISRIDICLDFEKFDKGDDPAKFVKRYIGHRYAKVSQSKATAHFNDEWERREFNSLSWGSKSSDITTKLYDKTRELYDESLQAFKKPYIIQAWFQSGLIDDPLRVITKRPDGTEYRPVIWRLEFSIRSNVKGWFVVALDGDKKKKRSIRNTLETYKTRAHLLPVFDLLQQHYFHFKKHVAGKAKYLCPDKVLFNFGTEERYYHLERPASPEKPLAEVLRLVKLLSAFRERNAEPRLREAASLILEKLKALEGGRLNPNPLSLQQFKALQAAIMLRLQGIDKDPAILAEELLELIRTEAIF